MASFIGPLERLWSNLIFKRKQVFFHETYFFRLDDLIENVFFVKTHLKCNLLNH